MSINDQDIHADNVVQCNEVPLGVSVRGKRWLPCVCALAMMLCAGGGLFASGQREQQLSNAEQLIRQKQYDAAITLITQVMKQSPREFDRAQSLLRQIQRARSNYNDKVAELIKVFNEGNLERAYLIIKEIETLDANPNQQMVAAQDYAKEVAAVVYDTEQFQKLMDTARPMLARGEYPSAINTYLSGFNLGMDLFTAARYGNIETDKINTLRADIQTAAKAYLALLPELEAAQSQALADVNDEQKLSADVDSYLGVLRQISALRRRIVDETDGLTAERDNILAQQSTAKDVPLVSYIDRIVNGRQDTTTPEGILAAIDDPWSSSVTTVYSAAEKRAESYFTAARAAYAGAKWESADSGFGASLRYSLLAERIAGGWSSRISVDAGLKVPAAQWSLVSQQLPEYLDAEAIAQASQSYVLLAEQARQTSAAADTTAASGATMEQLTAEQAQVGKIIDAVEGIRSTWTLLKAELSALGQTKATQGSAAQTADTVIADLTKVESLAAQSQVKVVSRIADLRFAPISPALADAQAAVTKAQGLLAGVPRTSAAGQSGVAILDKYPEEAQALLAGVQGTLRTLDASVSATVVTLKGEAPPVRESSAIQAALTTGENFSSQIAALQASVTTGLNNARGGVFQAQRFRQEGENRLAQAEASIGRQDFTAARQEIASAASSFDQSLSYEENPQVRQIRDVQIPQLSTRIADDENTIVVRDVRALINQGRALYSQGNYAQAQDVFLRAQSRWRTTNNQDDPEITTWQQYVETALSIDSGRVVAQTDPLYPEITQVLNLAQEDYAEGTRLLARGDRNGAVKLFNDAQQKLLYVQIPFPLNKEARVLTLKILEVTDPSGFRATFQQKFQQALTDMRTNPRIAYVSMLDLQAIDQGYPGLANALNQAEILTGIKRPPPDPAKIAQSAELYQKAFDIVRSNVRAQFPIALSYLNQAIDLDPNNQNAASLKDRISIDTGAETTVVLSNSAQVEYRQAQEQFIAKSYYEALRIVNQLLQDPKNQNYLPLIELKRRIESKI